MAARPEPTPALVSITQFDVEESEDGSLPELPRGALDIGQAFARGGMGAIHQAHDPSLGRVVALKVIGKEVAANAHIRARFLTEAQVTAQLDHPNIVPVYGFEASEGGYPAFTMKLIEGRTLEDIIKESSEEEWPLADRLDVFIKVCDALAYAHERGVVHRDLKPANVMVGRHGEVYVLDWGVAKIVGVEDPEVDQLLTTSTGSAVVTQAGSALGTPAYMSPEQARGGEIGPKSDQYALGLVLQELVTGVAANPGQTVFAAVVAAQDAERKPFTGPADLGAIIDRAARIHRSHRYPDVHELAADVRRFLRGEEVLARPDNLPRWLWRWTTRHPSATLTALLTVVISAAAVVISSLVAVLLVQQEAKEHNERVSQQVATVSRRAHEIDTELQRYRALLDHVALRTEALWKNEQAAAGPLYIREDFREGRGPTDYGPSDIYRMEVSFLDPLTIAAPDVVWSQAEPEVRRLLPLRETFREVFLRSHDEAAVDWDSTRQDRLLRIDGVPPAWVYVGLEDGVLLNYPGNPNLSDGYDPRKRPWYTGTPRTRGAHWGTPYPDDSGYSILVPCNRALYDANGQFFGVAGFDVALDTIIEMMDLDVDGVAHAWFIDEQGEIVVSDDQRGLNLGAGLHDNAAIEQKQFPYPEVHADMMSGAEFGHHDVERGELVFDRLVSLGWTYAVLFER